MRGLLAAMVWLLLLGCMGGLGASERARIDAEWEAVRPWLPPAAPPAPWDPTLAASIRDIGARHDGEPLDVERLGPILDWIEGGEPLPTLSCGTLGDGSKGPTTMDLYQLGKHLVAAGMPDHAAELGMRMRDNELLPLMVGTALAKEASAHTTLDGLTPRPAELFRALAWEASCMDAALAAATDDGAKARALGVDAATERLRARSFHAGLLQALHPVRDDPAAMRQVLARMSADAGDSADSPILQVIAGPVLRVCEQYLDDLTALQAKAPR